MTRTSPIQARTRTLLPRRLVLLRVVVATALALLSGKSLSFFPRVLFRSLNTNVSTSTSSIKAEPTMAAQAAARGGVIVFLHIPKSGGTTIRKTFQSPHYPNVRFAGVYVKDQLAKVQRQVQQQLTDTATDATLFVEFHDRTSSNLVDLAPLLRQWRLLAKQNGKPFSAFTILRDPIDHAVSLFNFLHVLGGFFGVEQYTPMNINGTAENFKTVLLSEKEEESTHLLFNPQCLYLVKGELFHKRVTKEECQWAIETLQETMDWIGDTKTLSQETLPYLHKLLTTTGSEAVVQVPPPIETEYASKTLLEARQDGNQLLLRDDLDRWTIARIQERSLMDQAMFESLVMN